MAKDAPDETPSPEKDPPAPLSLDVSDAGVRRQMEILADHAAVLRRVLQEIDAEGPS